MTISQPVQLNSQGDWCCPGCEGVISATDETGEVRDISSPSVVTEGPVTSFAIIHRDGCATLREIAGSGRV